MARLASMKETARSGVYGAARQRMRGLNIGCTRVTPCTGSYPCPPIGLHRAIRHSAIAPPRIIPYSAIASRAYAEQLGSKRHAGPLSAWITGEIAAR